jgi:hypothetical protein
MKAFKQVFWILPLFLSLSATADEYVGSSGKGGGSGEAPKVRAVASERDPALEIHQCEIVTETMGSFVSMAFFGGSRSERVSGTNQFLGLEAPARRSCNAERKRAFPNKKYRCSCATLASLGIQPTPEQIARYMPKQKISELTKLSVND